MTRLSASEVRERFADIYNQVAFTGERILVERHKKAGVAIVPAEDLELLERLTDHIDVKDALAALKEAEEAGTVTLEDFRKELGI